MTKVQKHLYDGCQKDLEFLRQSLAIWRNGKTGRTSRMPAEILTLIQKVAKIMPANILKREIGVDRRSILKIVNGFKKSTVSKRQVLKQQSLVDVTKYMEPRAIENVSTTRDIQIELSRPNGCRLIVNGSSLLISEIVSQFLGGGTLC